METHRSHGVTVSAILARNLSEEINTPRLQTKVAERAGITQPTLSRRLSGQTPFTAEELIAVASVLGTTSSKLLAKAEREARQAA